MHVDDAANPVVSGIEFGSKLKNGPPQPLHRACGAEVYRVFTVHFHLRLFLLLANALLAVAVNACAAPSDVGPPGGYQPGAVTGMHHVLLTVKDLARSVHFYRDVLGMRVDSSAPHFVMLQAGDFGVALSTRPWEFEKKGEPKGVGMIPHFTTPDMDEFAARLKKNGIPWLRAPVRESFGIEAFIIDPDGYQWAILAPLKPKPSGP